MLKKSKSKFQEIIDKEIVFMEKSLDKVRKIKVINSGDKNPHMLLSDGATIFHCGPRSLIYRVNKNLIRSNGEKSPMKDNSCGRGGVSTFQCSRRG